MTYVTQNCVTQWSYTSSKVYEDPFNDVVLDVLVTDPDGAEHRVPAFWAGDQTWHVRYSSPKLGVHRVRTECSDSANEGLHGQERDLLVSAYEGGNPLMAHGGVRVADDRRHLAHADGEPFLWLADTWWMGLCKRLQWPDEFSTMLADRAAKGFSVIQIVAGLYPDMPYMDERGANEAGFPWDGGYTRINPEYYSMADLRIAAIVQAGLVPCIVGCWGYFMGWMGVEKMKQHWRNLVARYGAYPVVWCLAGEGVMPYYLSEDRERDESLQREGWTELARYVTEIDPWDRLITVHPTNSARNQVTDVSVIDFDMLQTGHGDRTSIPNTVQSVTGGYSAEPVMPVINGEVCYEGIIESCRQEVQRFMFWSCVLSGAAGHTYGANGIWQLNREDEPYGPSPHGSSWGDQPWTEAYQWPGSRELGVGKSLLERYEWWRLEPHPEWVEPHAGEGNYMAPFAAGIPGELVILYMPTHTPPVVKQLEAGREYEARYLNPSDGTELELGVIRASDSGEWQVPKPPIFRDWVLVLEAR